MKLPRPMDIPGLIDYLMQKLRQNDSGVRHMVVNPFNPSIMQGVDNELLLWPVTDKALTISKLTVSLNTAAHEVTGDLKYADAFIGLANPVVINAFDTTSGVLADDSITVGAVPAGKCMFLSFDAQPNVLVTQIGMDIKFSYD